MITRNKIIILCGPSGSGKTTIAHHLLKTMPQLTFSVSATTRAMRENEKDGIDYHFLSVADFHKKISKDEFIEYEEVYKDVLYGTLKSEVQKIWDQGKVPVLDIDVVGALNIMANYASFALAVFVHTGSIDILKQRLHKRATENAESFAMRIDKAVEELQMAQRFKYVVFNDHLQQAIKIIQGYISDYLEIL